MIRPARRCVPWLAFALVAALVADASAAKGRVWKRRVEAGIHVTAGNSETSRQRVEVAVEGKGTNWSSEASLRGAFGESDGDKDQEKVEARARAARDLSPRTYGSLTLDYLYDGIADVQYRVVTSPAFGWYLLREETQSLKGEAGPAWIAERKGDEQESYAALRLAEAYEGQLTENARLRQGIEYLPDLRDAGGRYLLKASVELDSALDANLGLVVRLESAYDSQPADDKEKQDTTFSTSLKVTF
jgi:putative salt-induced outer membrane protein YdiY